MGGYAGFAVANLFAYRATRPQDLKRAADPVGAGNDDFVSNWAQKATLTVVGWGVHGAMLNRGPELAPLLSGHVCHLGLTKAGHPRHPLYVSYQTTPAPWPKDVRYAR